MAAASPRRHQRVQRLPGRRGSRERHRRGRSRSRGGRHSDRRAEARSGEGRRLGSQQRRLRTGGREPARGTGPAGTHGHSRQPPPALSGTHGHWRPPPPPAPAPRAPLGRRKHGVGEGLDRHHKIDAPPGDLCEGILSPLPRGNRKAEGEPEEVPKGRQHVAPIVRHEDLGDLLERAFLEGAERSRERRRGKGCRIRARPLATASAAGAGARSSPRAP